MRELHVSEIKTRCWLQARIWATLMIACIVLSTVSYLIKSLERFYSDSAFPIFDQIDVACFVAFSIEYFCRILSAPATSVSSGDETVAIYIVGRMEFFMRFGNVVDFLSIFPFFVNLIQSAVGTKSSGNAGAIARVVRIFRLVKMIKSKSIARELEVPVFPTPERVQAPSTL